MLRFLWKLLCPLVKNLAGAFARITSVEKDKIVAYATQQLFKVVLRAAGFRENNGLLRPLLLFSILEHFIKDAD